jgi:DnaK suppressor protein
MASATVKETAMNKVQLKKFKTLLTEKRDEIVKKAKQTLEEDMALDANDLPDEMDLASSEYLQSFTFRLRGREKAFLEKIQKALAKIDDGSFGVCEECGGDLDQAPGSTARDNALHPMQRGSGADGEGLLVVCRLRLDELDDLRAPFWLVARRCEGFRALEHLEKIPAGVRSFAFRHVLRSAYRHDLAAPAAAFGDRGR